MLHDPRAHPTFAAHWHCVALPVSVSCWTQRWENERQVKLRLDTSAGTMVVEEARVHVADEIKAELEKHKMMLEQAAVVDNPDYMPHAAVPDTAIASIAAPNMQLGGLPRRPTASFIDARNRRRTIQDLEAITSRIAKIADPNRDRTDLWRSVHGSEATRAFDTLAIHTHQACAYCTRTDDTVLCSARRRDTDGGGSMDRGD